MDIKRHIQNFIANPRAIFFQNLGVRQTVVKNTFWLAVSEGVSKLLKFFLFIYIARILGATEYGKFSFALAFVGLFIVFADLGVFKILTREFAKEPEKEKDFPALISLKILLSVATLILIFIGSFFITNDSIIRGIIWILGIEILFNSFLVFCYAFFRARQKMEYQSWGEILTAVLVTSFCLFVLFNSPSLKNLSWGYLFGTLLSLIVVLTFLHFKVLPLKLSFKKLIWKNYLVMSYPLALVAFMGSLCGNIDSTMMGHFNQLTQVGWYNAAQKIASLVLAPAGLIAMSFFPVLSKSYTASKERLQKAWNYYAQSMIFLSIPSAVGGIALAQRIIDFVYDPSYFSSIFAFQILLISFGIGMLASPLNQALVIFNQQKIFFWISLFGIIINVILNLCLIPNYSLYGASFATLCTFLLMFLVAFRFVLKTTTIKPINLKTISFFVIAVLSSVVMYLVISQSKIYNLYVIWTVLIGVAVYLFSFISLKIFTKHVILKIKK